MRSISRKPEKERWNKAALDRFVGTPWGPVPPGVKTRKKRHVYITIDRVVKHGWTPGCPRCDDWENKQLNHSKACIERFTKLYPGETHKEEMDVAKPEDASASAAAEPGQPRDVEQVVPIPKPAARSLQIIPTAAASGQRADERVAAPVVAPGLADTRSPVEMPESAHAKKGHKNMAPRPNPNNGQKPMRMYDRLKRLAHSNSPPCHGMAPLGVKNFNGCIVAVKPGPYSSSLGALTNPTPSLRASRKAAPVIMARHKASAEISTT